MDQMDSAILVVLAFVIVIVLVLVIVLVIVIDLVGYLSVNDTIAF